MDIGGTKCAVVAGRGDGAVAARVAFPTGGPADTLARAADSARSFMKDPGIGAGERPLAVGVSCGGPLDAPRGTVLSPPNLRGWDRVAVTDILSGALDAPAYLCNDANASAVAEWRFGAGRGLHDLAFLTFGTGMGAGLILGGRLHEGAGGSAGEVGHVRLERYGPVGYGKAGSFEGFCSGGGLAGLARLRNEEAAQLGQKPPFGDDPTAREVAERADAAEPAALGALGACGRYLGRAIAILIDILNLEAVVIGGIYGRCRHHLEPGMRAAIAEEALPGPAAACRVLEAGLGESIGDVAALCVAMMGARGGDAGVGRLRDRDKDQSRGR
ncbi:MAG: ROK family protein [Oscillospiraceae bacterium]|nr:ROK family protein [Oscillospiraceae bacterium]